MQRIDSKHENCLAREVHIEGIAMTDSGPVRRPLEASQEFSMNPRILNKPSVSAFGFGIALVLAALASAQARAAGCQTRAAGGQRV